MKNLKCLLKFVILFVIFSQNSLNAATITATTDGQWNSNIWSNVTGPQAGDDIIIPAGIKVYLNTLIDLSTSGNNVTTTITIDGELNFLDVASFCNSNCKVGLKLDDASIIFVNSDPGIKMAYSAGSNESPLAGNTEQVILFGSSPVLFSFPFGAGEITSSGALLPVELLEFKGEILSRSNELKWMTAIEENTSHFIVEKSFNGFDDYREIGKIEAAGFDDNINAYTFEDRNIEEMAYYRLKIVDFDGLLMFSKVIAIERSIDIFEVEVYPNPVIDDVNVSVNLDEAGPVEIKVFDSSGKLIQDDVYELNRGNNKIIFEMKGLKHQLYFINISYGNTVVSKKIMTAK